MEKPHFQEEMSREFESLKWISGLNTLCNLRWED